MPAPAAVYIIVAVVSVAAASVAFKEFVYEPHLAGKFEEYKNKAKLYYWKTRAARQRASAQSYHPDEPSGDQDLGDAVKRANDDGVEMEGLLKRSQSNHDSVGVGLRTNARNATLTSSIPPVSKTTSTDIRGNMLQHNQQIVHRNVVLKSVDELLDMGEMTSPVTLDQLTPSEPTATVTTPSDPFADPKVASWMAKSDHPAVPNLHSLSPFFQTHSLGSDSPVVLSPMTSPSLRTGALSPSAPAPSSESSEHHSSNPWDAISRGASPMSVADLRSSSPMSGWDSGPEHILDQENDESNLSVLSSSNHLSPVVSSSEVRWSADEDEYGSEGSFSTDSTSSSSIESNLEEGIRRELLSTSSDPYVGDIGNTNGLVNSLSDPEWDHFSDLGRRTQSP